MDLIIETSEERQFMVEVGFFDTVLEIKEKIEKCKGFLVPKQTLVFNGKIMADEYDIEFYEILQGSHIQLQIQPEGPKPDARDLSFTKIQLLIKIPSSKKQFSLEMDATDTVSELKEKIHELQDLPINRLKLFFTGTELIDQRTLGGYAISDLSEINVIIKTIPPRPSKPTKASRGLKRFKVTVLSRCGTKKVQVEVNASDNVGELREELQWLHQHGNFHLPEEGYFFIHKQYVMDEDRSFQWHEVRQGDTIQIFNGYVTSGSP